ncbi:hypothetical protein [Streptomyces sp. WELS2]|uniref:hypothetical protein n=1 Tax=Streptomyces sp. WELS2 TaxID=2749435 RepID=UPI0015F063E1|nr:hypothetical protein [Streptomyces sp. WELS2]
MGDAVDVVDAVVLGDAEGWAEAGADVGVREAVGVGRAELGAGLGVAVACRMRNASYPIASAAQSTSLPVSGKRYTSAKVPVKLNSEPPSPAGTSLITRIRRSYVWVRPDGSGAVSTVLLPSAGFQVPSSARTSTFTNLVMSWYSGSSVWSQG